MKLLVVGPAFQHFAISGFGLPTYSNKFVFLKF